MNHTMGAVDEIRRMFSAMRLSENSSKLVSIAPLLSASENETQLVETWKQIVSLLDSTESELNALDQEKSLADKSLISEMKREHSEMKQALEKLKQSVSAQIGLRSRRDNMQNDLRKLQNDLTDAVEPAIYAVSSWVKMTGKNTSRRSAALSDRMVQTHFSRLTALYDFKMSVNNILNSYNISDQDTASFIKYGEPLRDAFAADAESAEDIAKMSECYNRILEKITRLQDIRTDLSKILGIADRLIEYQKKSVELFSEQNKAEIQKQIDDLTDAGFNTISYTLNIKGEGNLLINIINTAAEADTPDALTELQRRFGQHLEKYRNAKDIFQQSDLSRSNPILLENITAVGKRFEQFGNGEKSIFSFRREEIAVEDQIRGILSENGQIAGKMRDQVTQIVSKTQTEVSDLWIKFIHLLKAAIRGFFIIAATVIVIILLLSAFIPRALVKPLKKAIHDLKESSHQVSMISEDSYRAAQHLAAGAAEQSSSLSQTSASLKGIADKTGQTAQYAENVNFTIKNMTPVLAQAEDRIGELRHSMDEITNASHRTTDIIKTMDAIAFQINLLALNASVEAARAGEAGAGFAVVANEVRNLARKSAEAAKATTEMIEEIIEKIALGSDTVGKSNASFSEIVGQVGSIGELVGNIASASAEQAADVEQIYAQVGQLDDITRQNSESADKSASFSDKMNAESQKMTAIIRDLVLLIGSDNFQQKEG